MKRSTQESINIAKHISGFINTYLPTYRTSSEHTLKAYEDAIALYLLYLECELKVNCETLTPDCFAKDKIENWLEWLMTTRQCSPATCNNRLAAIRGLLKYLGDKDPTFLNLYLSSTQIKCKDIQKRKVQGLSKEAVKALLDSVDISTKTGLRDRTLIIMLYSTATRIDEILSLKIKYVNIDVKKPYAIIGKGNKVRTLYLLPNVVPHIRKYLQEYHGDKVDPEALLFYSRNGGKYTKMTQPAVDKILKKYAGIAHKHCKEVPLNLHAHQLRHAKASHWLEDGMNIVQISFLLGHEKVETTMVYLDITDDAKRNALATLNDESEKNERPKWKNPDGSLISFCGVRRKE